MTTAENLLAQLATEFGRAAADSRPLALEIETFGMLSLALHGIAVELGRLQAERDRAVTAYNAAVEECNRAVVTCNEALAVARQVVGAQAMAITAVPLPPGVVLFRPPHVRAVPIGGPDGGPSA